MGRESSRVGDKENLGIHEERKIIGYARVPSRTQKDDLERQIELIKSCAKSPRCGLIINKQLNASINLYLRTWVTPKGARPMICSL